MVGGLLVHSALDFADGILAVNDFFVNACGQSALGTVAVSDLLVYPLVNGVDVCNPGCIFGFGKVVKLGNVIFASRVLRLGEVVQVGNFGFASFVISFGSLGQSCDFIFAGFVFSVKLSVELGNICDASLVFFEHFFFKRLDLIAPKIIFTLSGVLESIMVFPKSLMIASQRFNFGFALVVGTNQASEGISQF